MIVSKSQLQATLPDERRGRVTSCKIDDSVLLSYLIQHRTSCPRCRLLARNHSGLPITQSEVIATAHLY